MKNKAVIIISLLLVFSSFSCAPTGKGVTNENSIALASDVVFETDNDVSESDVDTLKTQCESSPSTSTQKESSLSESSIPESSIPDVSAQEISVTDASLVNSQAGSSIQNSSSAAPNTSRSDISTPETTMQEGSRTEISKQESSEAETSKKESSKSETSQQESSGNETSRQESSEAETSVQESSNTFSPEISSELAVPIIKSSKSKVNQIDISWNAVDGADGYIVHYSTAKSLAPKKCRIIETANTRVTLKDLKVNSKYYYHVCAFKKAESGQIVSSDWSKKCSEQLKSIYVVDGVTYIDGILIANKTYSLPMDFGDGLDPEAYDAFKCMARAAANDGIYLYIISDFRSYWTQSYTYNSFVYDRGVEQADRCSARPGHSEHQTGLAIDVNTTSDYFDGTPEAIWLAENCVKYGFIIRYPKGKESVTGYKYEPWHIRYLGAQKASEIASSGLTIEEYYGITSFYS